MPGPGLEHVDGRRIGLWWYVTGGGGHGLHLDELTEQPGLTELGSSVDQDRRIFTGHAGEATTRIIVRQGHRVWSVQPDHDGYVFLGRLASDPPITAVAVDADGRELGVERHL